MIRPEEGTRGVCAELPSRKSGDKATLRPREEEGFPRAEARFEEMIYRGLESCGNGLGAAPTLLNTAFMVD